MSIEEPPIAELETFALELGRTAGNIARVHFRRPLDIENKDASGFDPVTNADRAIESVLRDAILERYPSHGIVAEEQGTHESSSPYTWYVDPIDGTRSFMMGSPLWGTLIGLTHRRAPAFGLLCQPVLGEVFLGAASGAWLIREEDRQRLHTSRCTELAQATLASTHPDLFEGASAEAFAGLAASCRLSRYGGDCYNYAMLAAGFVDLVVEAQLKPFDIVPLIPIIEGAGGVVTDWQGRSPLEGGFVVAAATEKLHERALAVLQG